MIDEQLHLESITQHYNAIPANQRRTSVAYIRTYNNWIKSTLIDHFTHDLNACVLDLACGKGGDLWKYKKAGVRTYVGVDIADKSIKAAQDRQQQLQDKHCEHKFIVGDCFSAAFPNALHENVGSIMFDLVSCQFALHYAFSSEQRVCDTVYNISHRLKSGGHFIATVPDARAIKKLWDVDTADGAYYSSKICSIYFDDYTRHKDNVYGVSYKFKLLDCVNGATEFLVDVPTLTKVAKRYGLELICHKNFYDYYSENMRRRFEWCTNDEWAVIKLYCVLVFRAL